MAPNRYRCLFDTCCAAAELHYRDSDYRYRMLLAAASRARPTCRTAGEPLDLPARMSVRAAPHLAGTGLLEAVPESTLEALAAASAKDRDGAIGRLQIAADMQDPGILRVGRFGWRGSAATVLQQTAFALNADMGVTTSILPKHFCGQASSGADGRAADSRGPELGDADLELLVRYTSLLAVPPQRHFASEQPLGVTADTILGQGAAVRLHPAY